MIWQGNMHLRAVRAEAAINVEAGTKMLHCNESP
jgi:hypothetical protein